MRHDGVMTQLAALFLIVAVLGMLRALFMMCFPNQDNRDGQEALHN